MQDNLVSELEDMFNVTLYLSHVLLGCQNQLMIYNPLWKLLKQAALRVNMHSL